MGYDREPRYLHPYISSKLESIFEAINKKLPAGHTAKIVSAHRTPDDQFKLFKQGRVFRNGSWVKVGSVVTYLDGFVKCSRHNNLPCTAFDTGIFKDGTYLGDSPLYRFVNEGTRFGLEWGGDWTRFKDFPHLEIPTGLFFKSSLEKDQGLIWQTYLKKAGTYSASMDGIFGTKSLDALEAATGIRERNIQAWDKLYSKYGSLADNYLTPLP